jgi:hypothetical protein
MYKIILAATLSMTLVGCAGQVSDNETISVEPSMGKYGKLGKIEDARKFGYNNGTDADWKAAYASCASSAGIKGDVELQLQDFGSASTIDLLEGNNVSKAQKAQAYVCMRQFAAAN